jgi:hypothetical protein
LRDAHGYVEGLTKKRVDEYIESIDPSVLAGDERDQEDEEAIMVELEKLWGRVMIDMGGVCGCDAGWGCVGGSLFFLLSFFSLLVFVLGSVCSRLFFLYMPFLHDTRQSCCAVLIPSPPAAAIHLCKQESERGRHHPVAVRRVVAAVTSLGAHVESLTDECVRAQQSEAENKAAGHDNGHAVWIDFSTFARLLAAHVRFV